MPSYISFTLVFDCDLSAVVAHSHAVPLQNVQSRTRIPALYRNRSRDLSLNLYNVIIFYIEQCSHRIGFQILSNLSSD